MAIRFLTAGESHGQMLGGIIEGLPFGYELDFDFINSQLAQRQEGAGRGARMKIETDKIKIISGVRFSKTIASPLMFTIENFDFKNWVFPMSVEKIEITPEIAEKIKEKEIINLRPAHADLAGVLKYDIDDVRNVLERSSARETASRVAIGAICQCILNNYGIKFQSEVLQIGECKNKKDFNDYIKKYRLEGDSLGGIIKVTVKNPPVGLGSYIHWDKRLDGLLAQALMSVPAVKSVEIGLGKKYSELSGFNSHDEIFYDKVNKKYYHKTNNSGGIEGGMSNGEDIILTLAMKPIPTMKKALKSVEYKTHKPVKAHFERADNCAVEACGVVAKNMCATVILNAFLDKFGSDNKTDIDNAYNTYLARLNER